MNREKDYKNFVPSNPPVDYIGSIDNWKMELIYRGHIGEFYDGLLCHVIIEENEWLDILKECEECEFFFLDDCQEFKNDNWKKIKKGKR
jgi:hypothetical protein